MKTLYFSLFLLLNVNAQANPITGTWSGVLNVAGQELTIVFHIAETEEGYATTLDSPDQGATGIPTDETTYEDGVVLIKAAALQLEFEGKLNEETNVIDGTFRQNGLEFPLVLTKGKVEKEEAKARPQDPTIFPYQQEEVTFVNEAGGHKLAGTLTIPKDGKFETVAILISGSGPQNRDEELLNHRPFLVLSDYLTKSGIAVLRYDDRGVAGSEGDFQSATSEDFAKDVSAAMDFLQKRPDMEGKKIALVGHSEGGMIAPIVANMREDVDLIVSLAGPGIPIPELMMLQTVKMAEAEGAETSTVEKNAAISKNIYDFMAANATAEDEEFVAGITEILSTGYDTFSEADRAQIGPKEAFIQSQLGALNTNWFKYFVGFNPATYWSKVTCPVLAVNGELDWQVTAEENLPGIEQALVEGGNKNVTIKEFKGLNHLFQQSKTGAFSEYATIEETFNEEAMAYIASWINEQ